MAPKHPNPEWAEHVSLLLKNRDKNERSSAIIPELDELFLVSRKKKFISFVSLFEQEVQDGVFETARNLDLQSFEIPFVTRGIKGTTFIFYNSDNPLSVLAATFCFEIYIVMGSSNTLKQSDRHYYLGVLAGYSEKEIAEWKETYYPT